MEEASASLTGIDAMDAGAAIAAVRGASRAICPARRAVALALECALCAYLSEGMDGIEALACLSAEAGGWTKLNEGGWIGALSDRMDGGSAHSRMSRSKGRAAELRAHAKAIILEAGLMPEPAMVEVGWAARDALAGAHTPRRNPTGGH